MKIVLVGFAGCGKTTVGEYLVQKHNFYGLSFADSLKDAVSSIFCWDRNLVEGNTKEAREWREQVDPWWAKKLDVPHFTPRWALRHFGTDIMRDHFNVDIWINNVEKRIIDLGDVPVVVFDGRFPNEINLVRGMGGEAWRVKRGPEPYWFNYTQDELDDIGIHRSETQWIGCDIDRTIENNDELSKLYKIVDGIIDGKYLS